MFAPQSHSGFYRTTIAKCFLAMTITCSFVLIMPFGRYRSFFTYQLNDIFDNGEIWRLIPSKIAFLDTKDLIFGGLLIYYFRIFERRLGPRKFMSYIFCNATMATILELVAVIVLRKLSFDISILPSGPYSIIFPFFVPYYCEIPRVAFTHILGVPVTGKSFPYIMGLQIASSSLESALVCLCGLVAGLLYQWNLVRVQQWFLFPGRLIQLGENTLGPYLQSPPPADLNKPMGATLELQRQDYVERLEQQMIEAQFAQQPRERVGEATSGLFNPSWLMNGTANQANHVNQTPSTENIQRLVDMGFSQDNVQNALQTTNNDLNMAMNILLQQSS